MPDVTQIREQIEQGNPAAARQLLPLVYEDLKRLAAAQMAAERPDDTLQATDLVHEAYVRLVDAQQVRRWENPGHFFSAAAEAMRRILVESAHRKNSGKRGGDRERVEIGELDMAATTASDADLLLNIDAGPSKLAEEDPEAAELAKLQPIRWTPVRHRTRCGSSEGGCEPANAGTAYRFSGRGDKETYVPSLLTGASR